MKKTVKSVLLSLMCMSMAIILNSNVNAQRVVKHPVAKKKIAHQRRATAKAIAVNHQVNMVQAHKVIKRTNLVIIAAHKQVQKNKVYTGDLAKAVHHQRYAKKLLAMHEAHKAMQHSRLARKYAFASIRKNKGRIDDTWNVDKEEQEVMGDAIPDTELDKELNTAEPSMKYDDKTITDKEMTDLEVLETVPEDYKNE